ncbi:hypothetical protein MHC_03955 [Mycoplasma haemocanis str. Illinois]|uniref:Uncharacterized protein n=1 Tax=Mycoplasma haemocanis (strain Illinois) TaxID=1111676 RepID=H6N7M7_MYCHN|nr:hypothetical protein [Mycoplasma haemocanis]AEW45649.1 hypothetical protein MHC_03955 [Mycoplasma haemocanis str. Illinois]
MSITAAKLLKIGGPTLTGIGGVIATSSLVSKSADEKSEEKLKTKALSDSDPTIKEWKDRDESNSDGQQEGGGGENTGSETEGSSQPSGAGDSESSESSQSESGEGGPDSGSPPSDDTVSEGEAAESSGGDEEESGSKENGEGAQGLENGTTDAQHVHAHGNAYGTHDKAMTKQDVENVRTTRDSLQSALEQLTSMFSK